MRLRAATSEDELFLEEMLCAAVYWPDQTMRPPCEELLSRPELARYIRGWGRTGDHALIAESDEGEPLGAAWYRLFAAGEPGYGFVDAATPELAIAVRDRARGRGVGTALLEALTQAAHEEGHRALSLSVRDTNPAVHLYERTGFVSVARVEDSWTMRLDLDSEPLTQ